ncbi:hypothetical protein NDU88_002437 [Pleurodeles waltl]|uniref:Uncharacterized protein n=1 Tax=Pleurodeles waltl TaxID=8319 RepID=A0AAV7WPZ0_PLEWA|nr:hypothetical protein NDU88_002437 [Pleurodeles waltl]
MQGVRGSGGSGGGRVLRDAEEGGINIDVHSPGLVFSSVATSGCEPTHSRTIQVLQCDSKHRAVLRMRCKVRSASH